MIDDSYQTTLDQDIECSAVSELRPAKPSEMTEDSLLLVSVPGYDTESGYMSKFLRFGDLIDKLRKDFNLPLQDYWLVNENGFTQLHVVDGRISDAAANATNDYYLVNEKRTKTYHVTNGQIDILKR